MMEMNQLAAMTSPCSAAAERMRRSRERHRGGMRCYCLEIRTAEIEALIERGFLNRDDVHDKIAVADAFYDFFEKHLAPL